MHIMEGFLPAKHAIFWSAVSFPFLVYGTKKVGKRIKDDNNFKVFLGLFAAFTFVMSSLKIPSVVGSCSHPVGIGLGAIFLGPSFMIPVAFVVLFFQAVLLAHGGITTLGANIFSMGIIASFVGYFVYKFLISLKVNRDTSIFIAVALSDLMTYVVTSAQLAFAFPDPIGGILGSFAKFGMVFAITQIPISIAEGIIAVLAYNYIVKRTTLSFENLALQKIDEVGK